MIISDIYLRRKHTKPLHAFSSRDNIELALMRPISLMGLGLAFRVLWSLSCSSKVTDEQLKEDRFLGGRTLGVSGPLGKFHHISPS